jgi:hypothetical protein
MTRGSCAAAAWAASRPACGSSGPLMSSVVTFAPGGCSRRPLQVTRDDLMAVLAAARRHEHEPSVADAELLADLRARAAPALAADESAVTHLLGARAREAVFRAQVEEVGRADDEHVVVEALDRLVVAVLLPDGDRGLGSVEDVAEEEHEPRRPPATARLVQRGLQLVLHAEGLLVDEDELGREVAHGARDHVPPQADRVVELHPEGLRRVAAGLRAPQARQLHVVDAGRHAEGLQHGRAGDDEDGDVGELADEALRDREHPADVSESERVVRIDQDFLLHGRSIRGMRHRA